MVEQGFYSLFTHQKVDLHDDKKKNNNNKDWKRDNGGTPLIRPPTGHENLFKL